MIFLFRKRSWREVKDIPGLKSEKRQAAHKKKLFHCNSLTCSKRQAKKGPDINSRRCPHEGRVCVGIMVFVRTHLNCLKEGLTQSIKLSKFVRKFQKPYGLQTFASFLCGGTHLSQYCCPRGSGPAPLCLVPSGNAAHLSPLFMLYAQNYGSVPQNKKSSIKAWRNWPKTLCFCGILAFFPRHQICVSHINFSPQMEKHVWGSISHDTHLGGKRRCEIPLNKMFGASTGEKDTKDRIVQYNNSKQALFHWSTRSCFATVFKCSPSLVRAWKKVNSIYYIQNVWKELKNCSKNKPIQEKNHFIPIVAYIHYSLCIGFQIMSWF